MCDVIPERFQSVLFAIKLDHLGYRLKMFKYHITHLIAFSQGIML